MDLLTKEKVNGMLLRFKFSNYRCFADETVFDMTAAPIREHKNSLIENNGVQVTPVAAFYGANASGKSSFFMAWKKMCEIITARQVDSNVNYGITPAFSTPFLFDENLFKTSSEFEVCLSINEYEYRYGFECLGSKILSEYLYKRKLSKNETKEKLMFERSVESVISGDKINKNQKSEIDYCASMRSEKSLLLKDLGQRENDKELNDVFMWFAGLYSWENRAIQEYEHMVGSTMLNENFMDSSHNQVFSEMLSLLKSVDPCISDIMPYKEKTENGSDIYSLKTVHLYNNVRTETPINVESDGTRKFLALSFFIILILYYGGVIFIDELDSQLHPLLLRKIIFMFKDKKINAKGAQLIFSAHNIINLDSSDLRRDEIWFVEKTDHKSEIYSLYDFREDDEIIRSDLKFDKYYLSGRFGAVPFQEGN